jgi:CheY-like chemotaxis protein
MARVMEPFFTTRAGAGGTGLGLANVADFCRGHGGGVELGRSVRLGGARVGMRLPCDAHEPAALLRPLRDRVDLLVVEDEVAIRIFLQEWLDASGFCVAAVSNLAELREILGSGTFHLRGILMDWWILGTKPEEILELVREIAPNVPCIAMSGLEVAREDLEMLGIDRFLRKPFSTRDLKDAMERAGIHHGLAGGLQRGFLEDMSAE